MRITLTMQRAIELMQTHGSVGVMDHFNLSTGKDRATTYWQRMGIAVAAPRAVTLDALMKYGAVGYSDGYYLLPPYVKHGATQDERPATASGNQRSEGEGQ